MRRIALGLAAVAMMVSIGLGVAALTGSFPTEAAGAVVYVNDNLLPDVEGCNDAANKKDTIADGITAADPGDTVIVCEGTYAGNVTVNKKVTIAGREGADIADVVIEELPADPHDGLIITHDDVTIQHLTLNGPDKNNVAIDNEPPGYNNLLVRDVEITDWEFGVISAEAKSNVVEDSNIHGNAVGVLLAGSVAAPDDGGNIVRRSTIDDNDNFGIWIDSEYDAKVEDNPSISGNGDAQIQIDRSVGPSVIHISRNKIVTNSDGVVVTGGLADSLIVIGGSEEDRNEFSGPTDDCSAATGDCYLDLECVSSENTVDATYNKWGDADTVAEIDAVIWGDDGECDPHTAVVFNPWTTSAAPTPTPTATPSPTATPTPTATATATPPAATRDFDLPLGWNDFVWTGASGTPAATALNCIDGDYVIAYRFIETGQTFEREVPGDALLSNMGNVDQYESLLVLVTTATQCQGMPVAP